MKQTFSYTILAVLTIALILTLMSFDWPNKTTGYRLSGTLSETVDQVELDDLANLAMLYRADIRIMESFPMQFSADFKNPSDCDGMEKTLATLNYVASLGNCRAVLND